MGEANRRRKAKQKEILEMLLKQAGEDLVQIPLQEPDGWVRGIQKSYLPYLRSLWQKHGGDRQLVVYRIDAFWIKQWWVTPKGTEVERPDLLIEARANSEAKEALARLYESLGGNDDKVKSLRSGEHGSVYSYFSLRYAMTKSLSAKLPVNRWELLPLVNVIDPEGESIQAVQTGEFESLKNAVHNVARDKIEPSTDFERELFDQLIEVL